MRWLYRPKVLLAISVLLCGLLMCGVAFVVGVSATMWPSCGPRFTITEEYNRGTYNHYQEYRDLAPIFVVRRRQVDLWPVCVYLLSEQSVYLDLSAAKRSVEERARLDGGRVVATVP